MYVQLYYYYMYYTYILTNCPIIDLIVQHYIFLISQLESNFELNN